MRKAAATSPFEGTTHEDIHHRWLLWKLESEPEERSNAKQTDCRSETRGTYAEEAPMRPESAAQPVFQHRRYDAVIRRMQNATRQTGTFTSVS